MNLVNYLLILSVIIVSCKKDNTEDPNPPVDNFSNGLLVLNEGLFQQNNSSLSWVQFGDESVNNEIFEQKTGRLLGDTGNDIKRYGSKIYVIVNVSSTIEVLDAKSGSSIAQIEMVNAGIPKQPRSIEFYGGKAFVTCFDGYVDVIDTSSFDIIQRIQVGDNPEGIVLANNKLYVANSGGLNFPSMDSTVSVINPTSMTEIQKITVGKNPGRVVVDDLNNVYVIARGDYQTIPSRLVKIDSQTDSAFPAYSFDASGIAKMNNRFIILSVNLATDDVSIQLFNPLTGLIENSNFISAGLMTTIYNIQYDPYRNQIYVMDAMNYTNSGKICVFSSGGTYIRNYSVGLNPSKVLIYE